MPIVSSSSSFRITYDSKEPPIRICKHRLLPPNCDGIKYIPIKTARYLTYGPNIKTTLELTFDNSVIDLCCQPGDIIGVFPENDNDEVDWLLNRLNVQKLSNHTYYLHNNTSTQANIVIPGHLPLEASLKQTFQHFIDIRRIPSKTLLNELCEYTSTQTERLLLERISKEKTFYSEYILESNLSILDVLEQFPSCQPPITILMKHLPKLMPRLYSVCNSPKVHHNNIKICFSIAELNSNRKGVATGWLDKTVKNCFKVDSESKINITQNTLEDVTDIMKRCTILENNPNLKIPIYVKTSSFRLPPDEGVPIIMISNGTGIAPFIGFLEQKQYKKKTRPDIKFGSTWLYYGCRYSIEDFLYKKEIEEFLNDNTLSKLSVAHSKCDRHPYKYVQDCLSPDVEKLIEFFETTAIFYICGSNNMAKQVDLFFTNALKIMKNLSESDAKFTVRQLKKTGRIITDIWI